MIFPTVFNVSIYYTPSALLSTEAVLRIQPSVETKLPAVMEVSLQHSITRPNHLGHQQFAFSSDFYLMAYMLSGFHLLETSNSTGPSAVMLLDAIGISLFPAGAWK